MPLKGKIRPSYIKTEILESYPWIKGEKVGNTLDYTKIKSTSDYTILSIIKILFPISKQEINYTNLYRHSGIRLKKSFLYNLRFCLDHKLVTKRAESVQRFYKITDKGFDFLRLFA